MAYRNSAWRIFIDESGSPDYYHPQVHNFGERYFVLTAVICKQCDYKKIKEKYSEIRTKYRKYLNDLELKSRYIRRSNPNNKSNPSDPPAYDFWKYGDKGLKDYFNFSNEMKSVVTDGNFFVSSVGVDKLFAQTKYPHKDILLTCFMDLWERIYIIHEMKKIKVSRILYDPKRTDDDAKIKKSYQNFMQRGTWYMNVDNIKRANLYKNIYCPDSTESDGLQLADYCAYPIKRFMEDSTCCFFNTIIKKKLYPNVVDTKSKQRIYMGVKKTLSR